MSSEILGADERKTMHFFIDGDYASHLKEPAELAADVMVGIAGFPSRLRARFSRQLGNGVWWHGQRT